MKILVTGGAGFIGSHVVDSLVEEGHEVFVIDNLITGRMSNLNEKAKFYCYNLDNFINVEQIFIKEKPEVIFHLAAQVNVRNSVDNPVHDARMNILNSINLMELSRKFDVKKFIFSSTGGAIYGDNDSLPTTESVEEKPVSPYGCAKLAVEKYLHFYNKIYGLNFNSLRYSNVYGERQNPHGEAGVVAIFLNKMFNGESPVIFGGSQTRDFIHVSDVVNANLLSLKDKHNEIYNVGTGIETDIFGIFSVLNEFFNNRFKLIIKDKNKGEQLKSCLAYSKIRENLGWMPSVFLKEGLERTYNWGKKNFKSD